jgi:hypothetical protein
MPISRTKTDREIIQEAARSLAMAYDGEEFDAACIDMIEALQYGRSVQWWSQFEREHVA